MSKILSVVIPTLNEKLNVEKFASQILEQEKNLLGYKIEIIIADSHSTDGTIELVEQMSKKNSHIHLLEVERGIGVALIGGHKYALEKLKPDVLAQMDADGQVEAEVLPKLVRAIEGGYNLALGSRLIKGGKNELSFSRRFYTNGSSWICRIIMGPWNIKEFTNSARAFTPELFEKINLNRLPWREKTFINQPAFLNEAVMAGAKYIEVPLIFKDRAEGYSKNKTLQYMFDILTYTLDVRLHKWGLNIPFFKFTHNSKTFLKFGVVGLGGTIIDFVFYKIFINSFGFPPSLAKACSSEIAIVNNFIFNNAWTFNDRKVNNNIFKRFGIFNLVSLGGIIMSVVIVYVLHAMYGDGTTTLLHLKVDYNTLYFLATIPFVMSWNFTMNHFITWRHKKSLIN